MTFRFGLLASAILLGLVPSQAYGDGLFGPTNTVQAFYYNGVLADPEGEITVGGSTSDPASLTGPVDYQQGAADGSSIAIGNTQIVITNLLSGLPFCISATVGSACTDPIDGFDFLFTGEDILGVSVDPSSAADFLPVSATFQGNTHLGLQLISPNEIRVDVTGDAPALNESLTLDLSFTSATVPEPSSAVLLGGALALLCFFIRKGVSGQFKTRLAVPGSDIAGR